MSNGNALMINRQCNVEHNRTSMDKLTRAAATSFVRWRTISQRCAKRAFAENLRKFAHQNRATRKIIPPARVGGRKNLPPDGTMRAFLWGLKSFPWGLK